MDIQALMDAISDGARTARKDYHVKLDDMAGWIMALEDKAIPVVLDYDRTKSIGSLGSYRGYYADLAFNPSDTIETADKVLVRLKLAHGSTFEGYKGGDFLMEGDTPLWVAHYGSTGRAVIDMHLDNGQLVLITKDVG